MTNQSILFFACFLSAAFSRQGFFHTLFLARFQIKGMSLYFLNDVFLLYLAFKAAQCVLKGLALLNPNLCQLHTPPN